MKLRGYIFRSIFPSRGLNTHLGEVRLWHKREYSNFEQYPSSRAKIPSPELDWNFISDPANFDKISKNIALRKSSADLKIVTELHRKYISQGKPADMEQSLLTAGLKLPNMCADRVLHMGQENNVIFERHFTNPDYKLRKFEDIARLLSGARLSNLGLLTGERTYYLTGVLAELEQALIHWTVDTLLARGFSLMSVPDLLHPDIISACGMTVEGERTQVYHLDPHYGKVALSGTAEMAIGGYFAGKEDGEYPI